MRYETCHTCAVAIVNDDLSGLEDHFWGDDMDRIVASIESMGLVTLVNTERSAGYFSCYVCDQICLGEMSTFEQV